MAIWNLRYARWCRLLKAETRKGRDVDTDMAYAAARAPFPGVTDIGGQKGYRPGPASSVDGTLYLYWYRPLGPSTDVQ